MRCPSSSATASSMSIRAGTWPGTSTSGICGPELQGARMIVDPTGMQAISHLGWVDHGAIWVYRIAWQAPRTVTLSDAAFLRVQQGRDGYFVASHYFAG